MFKPLLASPVDLKLLRFPLLASTKLDGIRAIVRGGVVFSRSNKPLPNQHVQEKFGRNDLEHYDGEMIFGPATAKNVIQATTSIVMSSNKLGGMDVTFHVFDHIERLEAPYTRRVQSLIPSNGVLVVEQVEIANLDELSAFEEKALADGYEGLILRDPNARYKQGRSTAKEGILLKLKRWVDAEFTVIDFEERMENTNEKKVNELGRGQRSSHKAGLVGRGDLGALLVRGADGVECSVGTGFSDAMRAEIWRNRKSYLGKLAKVKWFPIGVKDAPRQPVFLAWRDAIDK